MQTIKHEIVLKCVLEKSQVIKRLYNLHNNYCGFRVISPQFSHFKLTNMCVVVQIQGLEYFFCEPGWPSIVQCCLLLMQCIQITFCSWVK